jgi:hypothetical protein
MLRLERAVDAAPAEPTRWLGVLAPVYRRVNRRTVFGVADSGVLVYKPTSEDHWAAGFALQTWRDDGKTYAKRLLSRLPAGVLLESRAQHLRWAEIASVAAHNGRWFHKMLITASDGSTLTLRWNPLVYSEGEVWPTLSYFLGDRFTVTPNLIGRPDSPPRAAE